MKKKALAVLLVSIILVAGVLIVYLQVRQRPPTSQTTQQSFTKTITIPQLFSLEYTLDFKRYFTIYFKTIIGVKGGSNYIETAETSSGNLYPTSALQTVVALGLLESTNWQVPVGGTILVAYDVARVVTDTGYTRTLTSRSVEYAVSDAYSKIELVRPKYSAQYTSGAHEVTLCVMTIDCSIETSLQSTLTADFSYTPSSPHLVDTIAFDASLSTPSNHIVRFEWSFGDGSTGNGATISHKFNSVGSYDVTLTVESDLGLIAIVTKTVKVMA